MPDKPGMIGLTASCCFCLQVLDALILIRNARIIHCDIKPENILLKSNESVDIKVIDMGSACIESDTVF